MCIPRGVNVPETLQTPGLALPQLVLQAARVALRHGVADVSRAASVPTHVEQHRRPETTRMRKVDVQVRSTGATAEPVVSFSRHVRSFLRRAPIARHRPFCQLSLALRAPLPLTGNWGTAFSAVAESPWCRS